MDIRGRLLLQQVEFHGLHALAAMIIRSLAATIIHVLIGLFLTAGRGGCGAMAKDGKAGGEYRQ